MAGKQRGMIQSGGSLGGGYWGCDTMLDGEGGVSDALTCVC